MKQDFSKIDVVVIGGGHAGIEAAAASAKIGCQTLLVTQSLDKIGELSCNPAIGGVGKGQLVKEVDAMGGLMGEVADSACIQYRQLNQSRGAAVRSSRMQVDMDCYRTEVQRRLKEITGVLFLEDEVIDINLTNQIINGVVTKNNGTITCKAIVLTPGTFFHGLIHIGQKKMEGGRMHDVASTQLPEKLATMGFVFGRFKTGTTPRLNGDSIDFSRFVEQDGDALFLPFSNRSSHRPALKQMSCFIGHTNENTHSVIRDNLDQSALYSGQITGTGVRYCPSVEDKIVKFPERQSHHVFVEPEGLYTNRYYPNGLSNSLPVTIQNELVHSIEGLEKAEIVQDGYGIEHDYLEPTQLEPTLETKLVKHLYFAGQINGTTGYEEAAAQGLIAGINAACRVQGKAAFVLDRSQAYIGVLIDDLITKGTNEPYRMFTSRVEYRLVIREDNADERLTPLAYDLGLVDEDAFQQFRLKQETIFNEILRLQQTRIKAGEGINRLLESKGAPEIKETVSLADLLRRSEIDYNDLEKVDDVSRSIVPMIRRLVEIRIKYEGYIRRQTIEIEKFKDLESYSIPDDLVYKGLSGLSLEVAEKLSAMKPKTLGQASRLSGVTPAAISLLIYHMKKSKRSQ